MNKEDETNTLSAPPRLLLGVAFLFWGAMHDQPLPALLAAILVEGRHWTTIRWEFGIRGFARSWQLSMVILLMATVGLLRTNELSSADFLNLLAWLPFMMLPLALAQQYAVSGGVPTITFSFIARRKMAVDKRLGRPVEIKTLHLGYPFFVLIVIAAGMGVGRLGSPEREEVLYAVGVVLLLGFAFLQVGGKRHRPLAWLGAYVVSMGLAGLMLWGLTYAYFTYLKNFGSGDREAVSSFETQTQIGKGLYKLQQDPKIRWRYYHERGEVPELLKLASYNLPYHDFWRAGMRQADLAETIPDERQAGGDFELLFRAEKGVFYYHDTELSPDDYVVTGRLVGMMPKETLIPHPRGTSRFEEVPAEILSVNSMGAFQLSGATQGAMEVTLYADGGDDAIALDPTLDDLVYGRDEEVGLRQFLEKVGLQVPPGDDSFEEGRERRSRRSWRRRGLVASQTRIQTEPSPPLVTRERFEEIEARLNGAFQSDFRYSLMIKMNDKNPPISEFLHDTRRGHCEFFAGATALLLRRMGVPCRYVVGFSVQENGGGNEWILRGQHAHAWVEAYVGGQWVNEGTKDNPIWRCRGGEWVTVDLTPPDWSSSSSFDLSWTQWFSDTFERIRSGLMLWTASQGLISGVLVVFGAAGAVVLVVLIYRLVMSRGASGKERRWLRVVGESALLRDFEKWLARRVGPRPVSQPMGSWLRKHLGEDGSLLAENYERLTFREAGGEAHVLRNEVRRVKKRWRERRKNPGAEQPAGS